MEKMNGHSVTTNGHDLSVVSPDSIAMSADNPGSVEVPLTKSESSNFSNSKSSGMCSSTETLINSDESSESTNSSELSSSEHSSSDEGSESTEKSRGPENVEVIKANKDGSNASKNNPESSIASNLLESTLVPTSFTDIDVSSSLTKPNGRLTIAAVANEIDVKDGFKGPKDSPENSNNLSGKPVMPTNVTHTIDSLEVNDKSHSGDLSENLAVPINNSGNSCKSNGLDVPREELDNRKIKNYVSDSYVENGSVDCVKEQICNQSLDKNDDPKPGKSGLSEVNGVTDSKENVKATSDELQNVCQDNLGEKSDIPATESFSNILNGIIADGKWEIVNCKQPSKVFILKCLDKNSEHNLHYIYFSKGTKLDELLKNKSTDDLNVSQEDILNCIDSINVDKSLIDQSFQSNEEIEDVHEENISPEFIAKELLNLRNKCIQLKNVFNENEFDLDDVLKEEILAVQRIVNESGEVRERAISNGKSQFLPLPKSENVDKGSGSKVEDVSGYTSLNESVPHNVDDGDSLVFDHVLLNIFRMAKTIYFFAMGYIGGVFNSLLRITSQNPTVCATTQTIAETDTCSDESTTMSDTSTSESSASIEVSTAVKDIETRSRIANFYTLFQHLSATAGTSVTADQVKEDINPQVVMDIYSGFHELRTVEYGSLNLMHKCIVDCIGILQNTMNKSHVIVQKSKELLGKETTTLDEMVKLNKDLKQLALEAEVYLNEVDRALTGVEDFTEDFIYYKNSISKELGEFLVEDFPEIFK